MRVVSDTSPLSNLAIIGRLELVQEQFGTIWSPGAVFHELSRLEHRQAREMLVAARQEGWLKELPLETRSVAQLLAGQLDQGEAEAIALASAIKADWLLIDEREGRQLARQAGLRVVGILGILMKAKLAGRIPSLQREIEALRDQARFFIGKNLEVEVLRSVGE